VYIYICLWFTVECAAASRDFVVNSELSMRLDTVPSPNARTVY
jgi:hypothetical protein